MYSSWPLLHLPGSLLMLLTKAQTAPSEDHNESHQKVLGQGRLEHLKLSLALGIVCLVAQACNLIVY